jgi:hypothetical protein
MNERNSRKTPFYCFCDPGQQEVCQTSQLNENPEVIEGTIGRE